MSLQLAHEHLGWPPPQDILNPSGAGPNALTQLAQKKIGQLLSQLEGRAVNVGVLVQSPHAHTTEAPLALVCEFTKNAALTTLTAAHKLAWNFSAAPLLLTVEPGRVRSWTCCEPPPHKPDQRGRTPELPNASFDLNKLPGTAIEEAATSQINWLNLLYGSLLRTEQQRFRRDRCADQLLLDNLREVRAKLTDNLGLPVDTSHDLLARLIFIQFLFQRKDSQGRAALNEDVLEGLYEQHILRTKARTLENILANHAETYRLFKWLNTKFNGDLFPSDKPSGPTGKSALAREMAIVTTEHLQLLSEFVAGRLELRTGQLSLWPQYSFDAIPLEFISSIYESFLTAGHRKRGAVYTPAHVVDFVLDAVLPWNSTEWDVRILDPACGSGIFLVKAFQRLIYRWRKANPDTEPKADILRRLLERNILGLDIEPHAVRTAVFSLYLALCDEIDPKQYWKTVRFPLLRGKRLLASDFFAQQTENTLAQLQATRFDLIIGNAPWGKNTATEDATTWARNARWPLPYGQIGPLFLPKALELSEPTGRVAMLQPAALIFGTNKNFVTFRKQLLASYTIEEVINLSALRFGLFSKAVSPACMITIAPSGPTSEPIHYVCPKPAKTAEDNYCIRIEPGDIHSLHPEEAEDLLVWNVLRWGGRRDLALVRRLLTLPTVAKLDKQQVLKTRDGIIRGDRKKKVKDIVGRRLLATEQFPAASFLHLDAETLPKNTDAAVDAKASTDFAAFDLPQLLIKKTMQQDPGRFRAVIVQGEGVICSHSYVSVHGPESFLETAALVYNSRVAVYFLFLTSSRLGTYRPEVLTNELVRVPVPQMHSRKAKVTTFTDIDKQVRQFFEFKEAEWALIDDRLTYTFPDFATGTGSPGRQTTKRDHNDELQSFCDNFLKVLESSLGTARTISATIFTEQPGQSALAVRMVAIHFGSTASQRINTHAIGSAELYHELQTFTRRLTDAEERTSYVREFRHYEVIQMDGERVPTIYLVRPDQARFWTRAEALREGDETVADLITWNGGSKR